MTPKVPRSLIDDDDEKARRSRESEGWYTNLLADLLEKNKQERESMSIIVYSSHGEIELRDDGSIAFINWPPQYPKSADELKWYVDHVERFDLEENLAFWDEEMPFSFDILDLGQYRKDGTYEGPCKNFRINCLEEKMRDGYEPTPVQRRFVEWCETLGENEMNDDVLVVFDTAGVKKELADG